jgi:hypothetical protein
MLAPLAEVPLDRQLLLLDRPDGDLPTSSLDRYSLPSTPRGYPDYALPHRYRTDQMPRALRGDVEGARA